MRFSIDGWNYTRNNGQYLMRNDQKIDYSNGTLYGAFYYYAAQNRIGRAVANAQSGLTETSVVRCVRDNPNANPNAASSFDHGGSLTN